MSARQYRLIAELGIGVGRVKVPSVSSCRRVVSLGPDHAAEGNVKVLNRQG